MATFEDTSISHDITTNAGFRAWVKMIQKALEECGIVKTADTGQINTETVETPTVNSTYGGYNIWRFNDANQSTEPIFFKLEYGRGAGASIPRLRWTVGTGSNGSGTISNASTATEVSAGGNAGEKGEIHCCFSEDTLVLTNCHLVSNATSTVNMVIERGRHPVTLELMGVIIASSSTAGNPLAGGINIRASGSWSNTATNGTISEPSTVVSNVAVPGFMTPVGVPCAPSIGLVAFRSGDVGLGETGKVKLRGKERTYKRLTTVTAGSTPVAATVNYLMLHQ